MLPKIQTVYVGHRDFEDELWHEITGPKSRNFGLVFSSGPAQPSLWAQDIWQNVQVFTLADLKAVLPSQKAWHLYGGCPTRFRDRLNTIFGFAKPPRVEFGQPLPRTPFGVVAMLDTHHVVVATQTDHPVPFGKMEFLENKAEPPNRAYLKLWEILTLTQKFPKTGDVCFDLGASPGGWTWVLAKLGAHVTAVDKSPLDSKISALPQVNVLQGSAFSIQPAQFQNVDWIFSDVICYPKRLLTFAERWVASGKVKNMICTVKLQGDTETALLRAFQDIPGADLRHLYHNKHELTWTWSQEKATHAAKKHATL